MKPKWIIAAAAAALVSAAAWGQWGPGMMGGYGGGYGPGMMGGYGPGYGRGYGPGMMGGYGPGMMGGYGGGYGPGMMGGYGGGYGPGMMGGYGGGYGPGMMGGYGGGYGPGMMGGHGDMMGGLSPWALDRLDLSDEQRSKIAAIQEELWNEHWGLMRSMHELRWKLARSGDMSDADADKAYDAMAQLQKRMFETSREARKKIDKVLTAEQKDTLRKGRAPRG